jgi:MFS family permease
MTSILIHINELLSAVVLVVAFSLFAYIALHNWRTDPARALCVLLTSIVVVYGGDVLLNRASRPETIQFLLRAQWFGIALVPAAYLHLARALLTTSSGHNQPRRWLVWAGYAGSGLFFLLALSGDLVVTGGITSGLITQFRAGPLFWGYVLFLLGSMLVLALTIVKARANALTPTLRRRMTYLGATFIAPALGVFPYLAIINWYVEPPHDIVLLLATLVSTALIIMITVMAYSVAFQGVLLPDRLIKYDFTRWGLYGPIVGITIILCLQLVPWLEQAVGLPADTLITFAIMIMTVIMPILISRVRPYLDALIYRQDQSEIEYLRGLPRSTFTRTDLRQLLENTLMAVCGALGVETGFVISPTKEGYTVRAVCGSRYDVKQFVADHPLTELIGQVQRLPARHNGMVAPGNTFEAINGFRLLPLHSPEGKFLGALGVEDSPMLGSTKGALPGDSQHLIAVLTHQMELALTAVQMQQRIFDMLRGIGPEMQSLQRLSTHLEQATPASLSAMDGNDVSLKPHFPQVVKDALTHYWGGPKLSDSPLLGMRTVRRAIQDYGGNPTRALQSVLRQAITNLRPDEQLDPSAQEWLLYNILEMRFLQGKRIRDVSSHLAMSESDFYRKQRIAVEEVARQLALMEDGEKISDHDGSKSSQAGYTRG